MLMAVSDLVHRQSRTFAINVPDLRLAFWLQKIATEFNQPLILQISQRVLKAEGAPFVQHMLALCRTSKAELAVHIDHCHDLHLCRQAIEWGVSGVLYDGSALPFAENLRHTQELVRFAKSRNVAIEGELAPIPGEEDGLRAQGSRQIPLPQVRQFLEETGVFSYAPFFGNFHGDYGAAYQGFDFQYLADIGRATQLPLVIHGGSGMTAEVVQKILPVGVGKINFSTDFKKILLQGASEKSDPYLAGCELELKVQQKFKELRALWLQK